MIKRVSVLCFLCLTIPCIGKFSLKNVSHFLKRELDLAKKKCLNKTKNNYPVNNIVRSSEKLDTYSQRFVPLSEEQIKNVINHMLMNKNQSVVNNYSAVVKQQDSFFAYIYEKSIKRIDKSTNTEWSKTFDEEILALDYLKNDIIVAKFAGKIKFYHPVFGTLGKIKIRKSASNRRLRVNESRCLLSDGVDTFDVASLLNYVSLMQLKIENALSQNSRD